MKTIRLLLLTALVAFPVALAAQPRCADMRAERQTAFFETFFPGMATDLGLDAATTAKLRAAHEAHFAETDPCAVPRGAMRAHRAAARADLDERVAAVLTEDQLRHWRIHMTDWHRNSGPRRRF